MKSAKPFLPLMVLVGIAAFYAVQEPADTTQAGVGLISSPHVYYRRCDDARAAGAAPIHVGEPGYRQPLDADGDGIACEPYP